MAWHRAAKTADVEDDDDMIGVEVGGEQIAIYKIDGNVYATHNVCTHEDALLSDGFIDGNCVECPLHQGQFDIATGKALSAPVEVDIKTYPTKIEGEDIFVEMPD